MNGIKRVYLLNTNIQSILLNTTSRAFSIQSIKQADEKYKLVIVGGGSGGISVGAKFARKLGANNVAIIEPSEHHCI